jgi:hypothetical protein
VYAPASDYCFACSFHGPVFTLGGRACKNGKKLWLKHSGSRSAMQKHDYEAQRGNLLSSSWNIPNLPGDFE